MEAGIDSGGLTREWFHLVTTELTQGFDRDLSECSAGIQDAAKDGGYPGLGQPMFKLLPDNSLFLAPSNRNPMFYMALGRVVGLSVLFNCRGEK